VSNLTSHSSKTTSSSSREIISSALITPSINSRSSPNSYFISTVLNFPKREKSEERDRAKMASDVPFSFNGTTNGRGLHSLYAGLHCRNVGLLFVGYLMQCLPHEPGLSSEGSRSRNSSPQNEIPWENLKERKTEWGSENGEDSFPTANCLPWFSWNLRSF
jgi:hypothetical protein